MMKFLNNFFKKFKTIQPEDKYTVIITEKFVIVKHPDYNTEVIEWAQLQKIKLINTDAGPWAPDIWLTLTDKGSSCFIPQGCEGFDKVFAIVSKYKGFRLENVTKSMAYTENAEFLLWERE